MWVTVVIKTHQFLIKSPAAPNPPYTISDFMITISTGEPHVLDYSSQIHIHIVVYCENSSRRSPAVERGLSFRI
jgi:hypothetical protein